MTTIPPATIAFVPRETVSQTLDCLDCLLEKTSRPYDLVVVVGGYPDSLTSAIRERVSRARGRLIEFACHVTPNEARNAALSTVRTRYIVFVDHDVFVSEGWLEPLVRCAEETGGTLVSPVVFEGRPMFARLHMVGGAARVKPLPSGANEYIEVHDDAHLDLSATDLPSGAKQTELIEFHTALMETEWLRSIGGLDPDLHSLAEHWDICITAARDGRTIYVEPESRVNYTPPKRLTRDDIRWFNIRWSNCWNSRSMERLAEKYDLEPGWARNTLIFLKGHRRHRFAPMRKHLGSLFGDEVGRLLAYKVMKPLAELLERPQLQRDLAKWKDARTDRGRAHPRADQPTAL